MWTPDKNFMAKGFSTPTTWRSNMSPPVRIPATERKWRSPQVPADDYIFHVVHKVPAGDSPYVRAKHVQLVDKDPARAIPMFWTAINSGDRVDSALKDMAVVMKQLNRSDEAIEAIKSFRHLCPHGSQESLDNILLELYKRSGRTREQIELLQVKLKHIEQGIAFGGKKSKIARSQGKKVQITIEQDYSRLLGNLAWAYLQQDNYKSAEEFYRKALSLEPDKNKQCNLAICLMFTNRMTEAKFLLRTVKSAIGNQQMDESYSKSYERAVQVMDELESEKSEGKDVQTPFSILLHRMSTEGYKNEPSLQSSPQRVFDNNMNRGCYTGGPHEKRVDFGYNLTGGTGNVLEVPYTEPRKFSWSCLEDQRNGWEREDAVGGCNKRLLFDKLSCATSETTGKLSQVERTEKSKKSWVGVVEKDDPKFFSEPFDFPDENTNCNVVQESDLVQNDESENLRQKMASLIVKEGYHTQSEKKSEKKPTSFTNSVKRSLCFDPHPENGKVVNSCSSPFQQKTLEFGIHESTLGMGKECMFGNSVKYVQRNRLQVFRDITLYSESPRP